MKKLDRIMIDLSPEVLVNLSAKSIESPLTYQLAVDAFGLGGGIVPAESVSRLDSPTFTHPSSVHKIIEYLC